MRPLALATLLLVMLSGCVPTRALPAPPIGAELDELIAAELDLQWQYVGLTPDSPRPTVERIRIVVGAEAEAVHNQCMIDAGYDEYGTDTSTYFGASNFERLALYTCAAQYPVPPSALGLFSVEQLDFLYDYYETSAVPCLKASNVPVDEIPSREEYLNPPPGQFFAWSPYGALRGEPLGDYVSQVKCPYYPEGFIR